MELAARPLESRMSGMYNYIDIGVDSTVTVLEMLPMPLTWMMAVPGATLFSYETISKSEFEILDVADDFGFPDVRPDDWCVKRSILGYAFDHGFMHGCENGMFGPCDSRTRGQSVTILHNMTGSSRRSPLFRFVAPCYISSHIETPRRISCRARIRASRWQAAPYSACR